MFFKTDAERAAAQAAKARKDAGEAGASAASGARNLGAAVLATLAEVTAPQDDKSGRRHAQRARAKALKAAGKDRTAAEKAAAKAAKHGRKAADHSKVALGKRSEAAGGTVAALAGVASAKASEGAHHAAEVAREQGAHAAEVLREQSSHAAEVLRDRSAAASSAVKEKAGPLGEAAAEKAGIGAALIGALAAAAREKASETRDRAVVGVDHGIDVAVPRAQEGVAAMAPKVDHLRDLINDELLPKIQAMLGDVQTGKDRALAKDEGVVATLTGGPKVPARKKKGGGLIALGLLAAAGAAAAWYLSREQQAVATDPWASQAGQPDPWASRPAVEGSTGDALTTPVAPVATVEPVAVADPVAEPAVEMVVDPVAGDAELIEPADTAVSPVEGEPRILSNEELEELAADVPPSMDEADTSDEDRPRA